MKNIKNLFIPAASLIMFLLFYVQAFAGTVQSVSVTGTVASAQVSGTVGSDVKAAVAVQLLDTSDNVLLMQSVIISGDTYSSTLDFTGISLTAGTSYKIRVADYDGGSWITTTFIPTAVVTPSSGGDSGSSGSSNSTGSDSSNSTGSDSSNSTGSDSSSQNTTTDSSTPGTASNTLTNTKPNDDKEKAEEEKKEENIVVVTEKEESQENESSPETAGEEESREDIILTLPIEPEKDSDGGFKWWIIPIAICGVALVGVGIGAVIINNRKGE
ncbi:MAG: hypothetical protein K5669_10085 [Lachnospiraceae bacterium]|nr:hypothetical protein [Lachnospiraceae bacterium]